MNHWPFVIAAYAVALLARLVCCRGRSLTMRRAEAAADALKRQ